MTIHPPPVMKSHFCQAPAGSGVSSGTAPAITMKSIVVTDVSNALNLRMVVPLSRIVDVMFPFTRRPGSTLEDARLRGPDDDIGQSVNGPDVHGIDCDAACRWNLFIQNDAQHPK